MHSHGTPSRGAKLSQQVADRKLSLDLFIQNAHLLARDSPRDFPTFNGYPRNCVAKVGLREEKGELRPSRGPGLHSGWQTRPDGSPLQDNGLKAGVVLPMGYKGPAFLTYDNYDVYLEWNQSATYALTAAVLATRFAGAPAYDPRNPDPGLSRDQMKQLQAKLEGMGYDVGTVDGILGTNTREAVRKEQQRLAMPVDGWPTMELLQRLTGGQ